MLKWVSESEIEKDIIYDLLHESALRYFTSRRRVKYLAINEYALLWSFTVVVFLLLTMSRVN